MTQEQQHEVQVQHQNGMGPSIGQATIFWVIDDPELAGLARQAARNRYSWEVERNDGIRHEEQYDKWWPETVPAAPLSEVIARAEALTPEQEELSDRVVSSITTFPEEGDS